MASTRIPQPLATAANGALPPGPKGLPFFGVALSLRRDVLGTITRIVREYGDIAHMPLLMQSRILVSRPEWIEDLIVRQPQKFDKGPGLKDASRRLLGEGLLTSEGELWRRQRRLAQPAFHRQRIAEYAQVMVEQATDAHAQLARWRSARHGRRNDGADARHRREDAFRN